MQIPLQQTTLWQTFLTALGETTFFHAEKSFTFLAILKSTPFGPYLYCPYGPHATTQNALEGALQALQALAISQHAIFIRIEPQGPQSASEWLKQPFLPAKSPKIPPNLLISSPNSTANPPKSLQNLKIPPKPFQKPLYFHKTLDLSPAHTLVLDLSPDPKDLIANFSSTTRNRFNTTTKRGLHITTSKDQKDLTHLIKFQSQIAKSRHFHAFSEKYLKTELAQPFTILYLAHFNNQVVGASLFFDHADTRFYMQSGTDPSPQFKSLSANVSILGQAILDAKSKGLKFFDFWGIAPADAPANHPWQGFTKFKKTFGGTPVAYLGTHDLVLNPAKYRAYQFLRQANRSLRRLI